MKRANQLWHIKYRQKYNIKFGLMNFTELFYISSQKDLYSTKMTKLFSKLNLTKLFSKLEINTIIHQPEWPKKLFTAQRSSLPGIDWREGTSQIVKCVGVETPHCGEVEMWWIHIVKMWRCGGSTF